MFLYRLSPSQRRTFIGIAKTFIEVDAIVEVVEAEALHRMEAETGISAASVEPLLPTPENLSTFDTPASRAAVMLELLGLAYGDGELHARENAFITEVATTFGISEGKLFEMAKWVVRQVAMTREAQRFLQEDA